MPNKDVIRDQRNTLGEIHLGIQRFVVLFAFRIFEKFKLFFPPGRASWFSFFKNPDEFSDDQIPQALISFQSARDSLPVRAAFAIHGVMDRFRVIKDKGFELALWWHGVRSTLFPGWRYSGYNKWLKADLAKRGEVLEKCADRVLYWPRLLVWVEGRPSEVQRGWRSVHANKYPFVRAVTSLAQLSELLRNDPQAADVIVRVQGAELAPDALAWIALSFLDHKWSLFYADSDRNSRWGGTTSPQFHPDFSLEYFAVANPAQPLAAISLKALINLPTSSLSRQIIDPKSRGSLSFDELFFDVLQAGGKCHHERKILSHKFARHHQAPTLSFTKAVSRYLVNTKSGLEFNPEAQHFSERLKVVKPQSWPRVSIIVPTKDGIHLLRPLIEGLQNRTEYPNFDVLILNNNSTKPETFSYFAELRKTDPRIRIVDYPEPYNFSKMNNFALKHTTGDVLALMNNDVEVLNSTWLKEMVAQALRPDVGAVGAKLYFPNRSIQHAGVVLGIGQVAQHIHTFESARSRGYLDRLTFAHEFSAVTCACFVLRRDVFEKSGLFSEDLAVAYNDIDFCLKIKEAGFRIIWTPRAELIHKESSTRPSDRRPEQLARYRMEVDIMRGRWMKYIANDPYYNPQLTRDKSDFSLNWKFDWYQSQI